MLTLLQTFASACETGGFFGLPTWYKYLTVPEKLSYDCTLVIYNKDTAPNGFQLVDIWQILTAVIEMAIYVAGIIAVVMIIWGGFRLIISQGNPDSIKAARNSVLYATIGLVVSISARALINVVMGIFK